MSGLATTFCRLAPCSAAVENDARAELHADVRSGHPALGGHLRRRQAGGFDGAIELRQGAEHDVGADHRARAEIDGAEVAVAGAQAEAGRGVALHAPFDPEVDDAGIDRFAALRRRGELRHAHRELHVLRPPVFIHRHRARQRLVGVGDRRRRAVDAQAVRIACIEQRLAAVEERRVGGFRIGRGAGDADGASAPPVAANWNT